MPPQQRRPFLLRAARFGWNFARDSDFRSVMLLRWQSPPNLFQPFAETSEDRYPEIFRFARDTIGDEPERMILSFGCSTGEEVLTLRKYFPHTYIKGLDINRRNVAAAQAKLGQMRLTGIEFGLASSTGLEPAGRYDAIFAMSVFRHGGLGENGRDGRCDHLIRFADFEAAAMDLARALRPGGLLFIANSNFRFNDAAASADFEVVLTSTEYAAAPGTPIFDRDNRYVPHSRYSNVGFRKRAR
jgi:SAM-dependent methyltransferase